MSKFFILDKELVYEEGIDHWVKYFFEAKKVGEEAAARYEKVYEEAGSMEKVLKEYKLIANEILKEVCDKLHSQLVDFEIYDISKESFLSKYSSMEEVESAYDMVWDDYIVFAKEKEYQEKLSFGEKLQNGYVSLNKAIKLYYTEKVQLENLLSGIKIGVLQNYELFEECVNEHRKPYFSDYRHQYSVDKAEAICESAKRITDREKKAELLIESLKTGPLNNPSYEYIIETFGDANNEVEKMAMQFFENWDKGKKKAELLDQYICSIDYTSERSLEEEIDKCKTICGYYGMDSEKYLKQLKKIIEKYKEIARTCDGICYDNSADLEIAKKEVEEFRDKTYALDANDEKKIQDVRNYIAENFKMHSKEKYLRFLDKALEDYDLRYRTVKDIVYETREEADKVKSEWDYLEDIRKATDYNSVDSLKNAMVKITEQNWTISADINYIEFFQNCLELYNEAKSIVANSNYTNREEQTEVALKIMLLNTKYEAIGVKNLEFEEFTDEFMNNFFEIMNKKCDSILSANTEYYKALEHAQSYFTNVVSKSTEKKFFFSKIVDGAKEMLAKGYVDEYNYFTNNGTSILPSDTKDNGKKVEEIVKSKLKNIENIKKEYELKHQEVGYRWKLGSKKVYGELILVDNAIVTKDFVCAVMKEVTKFHSPQHIPEFTEVLAVRDILEKKYRRFAPMTIEYSEETGGYLQEFLTEKEEFLFNVGDVVYIIKNANDGFFIEGGLEVMEVIGKKKPDFWKVKIKSNKKIEDIFKENIKSRVWVVGF